MGSGNVEVSVYCAAYNHEKYIRAALNGFVLQKTNFRFEVLVHDDASIDGTADIIREYEKRYPDTIVGIYEDENQHSQGVSIYKKHIAPRIKGKYVCFCEGDDFWEEPYKLQMQYDTMESNKNCSICFGRTRCIKEDGSPAGRKIPDERYYRNLKEGVQTADDLMCRVIVYGLPSHTSSVFLRKEALDVPLSYPRDEGAIRKALVIGDGYFINEVLSVRRLWSIGNWNSRLEAGGNEARLKLLLSNIEHEKVLDDYTRGKYHDAVICRILKNVIGINGISPRLSRSLKKDNGLTWKSYKILKEFESSLMSRIKCILYFTFPGILWIIQRFHREQRRRYIDKHEKVKAC